MQNEYPCCEWCNDSAESEADFQANYFMLFEGTDMEAIICETCHEDNFCERCAVCGHHFVAQDDPTDKKLLLTNEHDGLHGKIAAGFYSILEYPISVGNSPSEIVDNNRIRLEKPINIGDFFISGHVCEECWQELAEPQKN